MSNSAAEPWQRGIIVLPQYAVTFRAGKGGWFDRGLFDFHCRSCIRTKLELERRIGPALRIDALAHQTSQQLRQIGEREAMIHVYGAQRALGHAREHRVFRILDE